MPREPEFPSRGAAWVSYRKRCCHDPTPPPCPVVDRGDLRSCAVTEAFGLALHLVERLTTVRRRSSLGGLPAARTGWSATASASKRLTSLAIRDYVSRLRLC